MLDYDEDALICDLAETYGIYDYESLPLQTVATLSIGLRGNSRIKMKAVGLEVDINRLLLAHIADNTAINWYLKTKDAEKGENQPKSFVRILTDKIDESKKPKPFRTSADFDAEWRRLNGS